MDANSSLVGKIKTVDGIDGRRFVPDKTVERILTRNAIENDLRERLTKCIGNGITDDELQDLVTFIRERCRKVYSICIYGRLKGTKLENAMRQFKKNNWSDKKLPIDPYTDGVTHELATFGTPWDDSHRVTLFYEAQWRFLAPVFTVPAQNLSDHAFKSQHILPFIERHEDVDRGSFGRVRKFTIHPDHLVDKEAPRPANTKMFVAVKELVHPSQYRTETRKSWVKEANILQKMNDLRQEHIVRFLAGYSWGDPGKEDYYLMFEWADGINLRCLWNDTTIRPCLTGDLAKAVIKQIMGLAMALCRAHCPETRDNYRPTDLLFRHGDLKPENILWFKDNNTRLGTLKIADFGLAKQNNVTTAFRTNSTSTGSGTVRYQPPEEELDAAAARRKQGHGFLLRAETGAAADERPRTRSRLYDIWGMGCITLEFLVWLLYGGDALRRFNNSFKNDFGTYYPFYQVDGVDRKVARVHDIAVKWMDHMADDPACKPKTTALGDLLKLVRGSLLVVKLPPNRGASWDVPARQPLSAVPLQGESFLPSPSATVDLPLLNNSDRNGNISTRPDIVITTGDEDNTPEEPKAITPPKPTFVADAPVGPGPFRVLTPNFLESMQKIYQTTEPTYWFTDVPNRSLPPGTEEPARGSFPTRETNMYTWQPDTLAVTSTQRIDYGVTKLDDEWDVDTDHAFAKDLSEAVKAKEHAVPNPQLSSALCQNCTDLRARVWDLAFDSTYVMRELQENAEKHICDLCALLWHTCTSRGAAAADTVLVEKVGSSLRLNGSSSITLSVRRSGELLPSIDDHIQLGCGTLCAADSEVHFEIIRRWLTMCDDPYKHPACAFMSSEAEKASPAKELPTRVIAVGEVGDTKVRLRPMEPGDAGPWVALSYRWGPEPHFCTTASTLNRYLQNGIDLSELPATFRDAVTVTRALGCIYLWIDALCIVQGDDGDFNEEAKRMPQVYSGAYCVLAASRAVSHYDGFLRPRKERRAVTLQQGNQPPFYIAENVDDFNGHVLEGELNSRGWVLQEHALARRTVFFTDYQTYFECGDGVRCETMTIMRNNLAAFLGDPNFPRVIQKAERGEMILRYQDLYRRYSRLGLSRDFDRPTAIDGLQRRILDALRTKGGFGVFDQDDRKGLLQRSLLWVRAPDHPSPLRRIAFPPAAAISSVPSWSWMACAGAIDYLSPPFGRVAWERLQSPWSGRELREEVRTETDASDMALVGEARRFDPLGDYRTGPDNPDTGRLVYDAPGQTEQPATLCVVMGIQKSVPRDDARCYFLIVKEATGRKHREGEIIYERAGAGYLPGRYVDWTWSVRVTIH